MSAIRGVVKKVVLATAAAVVVVVVVGAAGPSQPKEAASLDFVNTSVGKRC